MFPSRPLKVTCTRIVCAVVSKSTIVKPVPGEALGGDSAGPDRFAVNVTKAARAAVGVPSTAATQTAKEIRRDNIANSEKGN